MGCQVRIYNGIWETLFVLQSMQLLKGSALLIMHFHCDPHLQPPHKACSIILLLCAAAPQPKCQGNSACVFTSSSLLDFSKSSLQAGPVLTSPLESRSCQVLAQSAPMSRLCIPLPLHERSDGTRISTNLLVVVFVLIGDLGLRVTHVPDFTNTSR